MKSTPNKFTLLKYRRVEEVNCCNCNERERFDVDAKHVFTCITKSFTKPSVPS